MRGWDLHDGCHIPSLRVPTGLVQSKKFINPMLRLSLFLILLVANGPRCGGAAQSATGAKYSFVRLSTDTLEVISDAGEPLAPWPQHVYHWHREGLTLPSGAERLATGNTFENQAFRYNHKAFGIQFHPEVTRLTMHRWAVLGAHRFDMPGAQNGKAHLDGNLVHDGPVRNWLSQFLDGWLAA